MATGLRSVLATCAIVMAVLSSSTAAHAVTSCTIRIENAENTVIKQTIAGRKENFGGRIVRKLKACGVCWKGGRTLSLGASYCGAGGDEYKITCTQNNGQQKQRTYHCP